jgi:hypothetical protein
MARDLRDLDAVSRQMVSGTQHRSRPAVQRPVSRFNIITIFLWVIGLMVVVGVAQKVYKYISPLL